MERERGDLDIRTGALGGRWGDPGGECDVWFGILAEAGGHWGTWVWGSLSSGGQQRGTGGVTGPWEGWGTLQGAGGDPGIWVGVLGCIISNNPKGNTRLGVGLRSGWGLRGTHRGSGSDPRFGLGSWGG